MRQKQGDGKGGGGYWKFIKASTAQKT